MHIQIIAVGKQDKSDEIHLIKKYLKRLKYKVIITEIPLKNSLVDSARIEFEACEIIKKIQDKDNIIVLDEKGQNKTSQEFSKIIDQSMMNSKNITFIIGGAYGLSENIKQKANSLINFGNMTLPHMLVRVILLEQIYRSQQILNNHPYHK